MYNTPPTVPNGDDTSLHLQFHSEISPSVSLPPRQSITQATKPRRTRSSGEAAFWNARAICTCQGKTVNSVHLPSGIWKPPPLFIKQQSAASPVTPRLQAPASRLSQGTTGSAPFAVTFPDSSLAPPNHEPAGCPHPAPSPPHAPPRALPERGRGFHTRRLSGVPSRARPQSTSPSACLRFSCHANILVPKTQQP